MTDTKVLLERIEQSGKKINHLCRCLGVANSTFYSKVKNQTEFKISEVDILCDELGIDSPEEKDAIFFCRNVESSSTE